MIKQAFSPVENRLVKTNLGTLIGKTFQSVTLPFTVRFI